MEMKDAIIKALTAVRDSGFTNATSDNITSIACTLYIQGSKGQSKGGYKSNGRSNNYNSQTRNVPPNQIMQIGAPCNTCGYPLISSSKGNPYCKCWYK